ncbi:TPA: glycosyltransferase family 4 protein [Salmonella enterica subsp. enterica serovar Mississippi]|nr:glycosyltransferase family 4 protein [Salmonella enterica subsp. enterica]ECW0788943.1 glycosyltransferase family 4 protein [Salmonella enterica subsp. enterica]HED0168006.1 glycosyltransferase family 4 protein [Salmonella enterica subsp. enterica serovar Mississippi]HED0173870.1 glycosyltransferase family 4 protein [Salmonella enterica subsp. enterica serovar Mississippi]HED0195865.1 glycosyltransferase family 4 protein [Salmonella enterica subsp. enterica serovar Mississippi]
MNILYTESSLNIGGQELQAVAQMMALQRAGYPVLLACRENSRIAAEAIEHGIMVTYVSFRNSLHLHSVCRLRQIVCRFRPAMVVCHSGHDSNIVALARATLPGKIGRFCIIRQKTYLTQRIKTFALNHLCDVVVVPGEAMRDSLLQAGCRRPVSVLPPGIDFDRLHREMLQAVPERILSWLKCREPAPVIVQVAMLRPEKGYDFMLETLFHLKREGGRFRWLIAGRGKAEEENRLKNMITRLGMEDCVLMCGLLSPVAPLYRIASLMVMPSRNESFGMAAVEAAACGVPVMASNVGGLPQIIQHDRNGTLLPPDDLEVWLEALHDFLLHPGRAQEMALHARKDMMARYGIDRTISRLLMLQKQQVAKPDD